MEELFQLRIEEHELSMRQMVEEIYRGQLNICQAVVRFEVNRKTVKHWLDKLKGEVATAGGQSQTGLTKLPEKKKRKSPRSADQSTAQVKELKARMFSLEQELEASNFQALYYSSLVRIAEQKLGIDIEEKVRYQAIRFKQVNYPNIHIRRFERLLGFGRQGYYQYWQRQAQELNHEDQILELEKQIREDHPRIGGRKLYQLLDKREIKIGRDAFFDLLSTHKLLIRRRRRRVMTTFSRHRFRKYPNLIKELAIERPNQVWVRDITYWFTGYACLYISLVTDACPRRIMGYTLSENLEAVNCKEALLMALQHIDKRKGKCLIHHSDRGIPYCSNEYVQVLESYYIQISMTGNGDPLENPIAERVKGIRKQEYLSHQQVYSLIQAKLVLEQAVFLYNYKRPHLSCDMLPPDQAHLQTGQLKRRWKNYYGKKPSTTLVVNENQD